MNPMQTPEEEELDPRRQVLKDIMQWAQMSEADGMRERYGKPPRPPLEEEAPPEGMGEEAILGVETTEDGEAPPMAESGMAEGGEPPLEGEEELDEEKLKAALAAMGG